VDAAGFSVNVGRYEDDSPMRLPVPGYEGAHWLVGGSTGSGKTSALKVMLAETAVRYGRKVAFAVSDPHLLGFRRWEPRVSALFYGARNAVALLALVEAEMQARYRAMHDDGSIDEWTLDLADRFPYVIVVLDEVAAVTLHDKKNATPRLVSLAQETRKAGIGLVIATQSPKASVVDNMVREQCPIRICFRTREPEQTEAILGSRRWPCHEPDNPRGIPLAMKGGCYVDDGYRTRRGRTRAIDKALEAHVANDYSADTPDLGWPRVRHPHEAAEPATRPARATTARSTT